MDVNDGVFVEFEDLSCFCHGAGEGGDFFHVHAAGVAGDDKAGEFDVGEFVVDDVFDDRGEFARAQAFSVEFAFDVGDAFGFFCAVDGDKIALFCVQGVKDFFEKSDVAGRDCFFAFADVKDCDGFFAVFANDEAVHVVQVKFCCVLLVEQNYLKIAGCNVHVFDFEFHFLVSSVFCSSDDAFFFRQVGFAFAFVDFKECLEECKEERAKDCADESKDDESAKNADEDEERVDVRSACDDEGFDNIVDSGDEEEAIEE